MSDLRSIALCLFVLLVCADAGAVPLANLNRSSSPAFYARTLLEALPSPSGGAAPGTWVELAVTVGGVEVGPYLRVVHASEEGAGSWIELWISQRPGSGSQAFRLLLLPDEAGRPSIRRVQVRTLGGHPTDLPLEAFFETEPAPVGKVAAGDGPQRSAGSRRELRVSSARAPVLTGAGTIRAERVEVWEGRQHVCTLWRSEQIPLFGLVQADFGGVLGLRLHGMGGGSPLLFEDPPAGTEP